MLFDFVEESYRAVATEDVGQAARCAARRRGVAKPRRLAQPDGVTVRVVDLELPPPYVCRPYRRPGRPSGDGGHASNDHCAHVGNPESHDLAQFDNAYANLVNCDPASGHRRRSRTAPATSSGTRARSWEDREDGTRDCVMLRADPRQALDVGACTAPCSPARSTTCGRGRARTPLASSRSRPIPGRAANHRVRRRGSSRRAISRSASVPTSYGRISTTSPSSRCPTASKYDRSRADQLRMIFDAEWEAFRGSFGFREPTEQDFERFRDDPLRDETLWKIAWSGDTIVGQVKTFVNDEENARIGCKRGWTEDISTHAGLAQPWHRRGAAGDEPPRAARPGLRAGCARRRHAEPWRRVPALHQARLRARAVPGDLRQAGLKLLRASCA